MLADLLGTLGTVVYKNFGILVLRRNSESRISGVDPLSWGIWSETNFVF